MRAGLQRTHLAPRDEYTSPTQTATAAASNASPHVPNGILTSHHIEVIVPPPVIRPLAAEIRRHAPLEIKPLRVDALHEIGRQRDRNCSEPCAGKAVSNGVARWSLPSPAGRRMTGL